MSNRILEEKPYLLTCSLRETSIQENINCLRNALFDGADAFMLHLEKVPDEELTYDKLKKLYDYAGDKLITTNVRQLIKKTGNSATAVVFPSGETIELLKENEKVKYLDDTIINVTKGQNND